MLELQDLKHRFDIVGNSPALNYALSTAEKVAITDLSVLIVGESGTGKEVFSKIIHQISYRRSKPFIAINCGAIPEGTIDSELFGHEKGSFTGALDSRKGYFETVNGGTIFLDEIGEMPLSTQSRLLRVLQSGEYIKVGSSSVLKTDVRVIAATNVNLMEAVSKGKFREDLYYRLNTVPIEVPPLRDRGEDILLLFRKFSFDFCERNRMPRINLSPDAEDMLMRYRWPGNIRQLKSVAEQVHLLATSDVITAHELVKFLPNNVTNLNLYNSEKAHDPSASNITNELIIKMLLELKQDVNEIKRAFLNISSNSRTSPTHPEFHTDVSPIELPPSSQYVQPFNKFVNNSPNIIEIENRSKANEDFVNLNLADMEKVLIQKALIKNDGKRKYAAIDLGISERTLYRKILDYDINI